MTWRRQKQKEPSGEGDERLCDDVKSCLVKASLSGDLKSASVETPSLNCVEKTETEKPSGEDAEDFCDGSDSNDESLEPESELWRGSVEQRVRQDLQQLAERSAAQDEELSIMHEDVCKIREIFARQLKIKGKEEKLF